VIATTIINCFGSRFSARRAFHFHSGEDANTVVAGFTITGAYQRGPLGMSGLFGAAPPIPYEPIDPTDGNSPPRAERGRNSFGDGYGGGILCEAASSPLIKNCVITNCTITGAQGGNGALGQSGMWIYQPPDPNLDPEEVTDGQWGGHGGDGYGNGHGGAIACLESSCPIIVECVFSDNFARGGVGGIGGNGGFAMEFPNYDQGFESGAGSGGNGIGDGFGGAIYCENGSVPTMKNCTFISNTATFGDGGAGGVRGLGNPYTESEPPPQDPNGYAGSGSPSGLNEIAGGAICWNTTDSAPIIIDCNFISNQAYDQGGAFYSNVYNIVDFNELSFTSNTSRAGGAIYCEPNCILDLDDCSFASNSNSGVTSPFGGPFGFPMFESGGAIYISRGGFADVNGCTFTGNSAVGNGGALYCMTDANLANCFFTGSSASGRGGVLYGYAPSSDPNTQIVLRFDVNSCIFAGSQAGGGGGAMYLKDFEASFNDCYFVENVAQSGGALLLSRGTVTVNGGLIYGNRSIGGDSLDMGGGLACSDTTATIENCTIERNSAEGFTGTGGGIAFYGGDQSITHLVKNCLMLENSATVEGGAISSMLDTAPEIRNCTFVDNGAGSFGGAVFCDWMSSAHVSDSIFTDCENSAICEEDIDDAIIEYSLFYNNPDGDYGLYDSNAGLIYTFDGNSLDPSNINGDPNFVGGPLGNYYLDQDVSPAVDRGSDDANDPNIGMDIFTTDPNGSTDTNRVDFGYHYRDVNGIAEQYQLTLAVAGGQGTVEPTRPTEYVAYDANTNTYTYYAGTVVTLTATPDTVYRVRRWSGTLNDGSTANTNVVIMLGDRDVAVEFRKPKTILFGQDPSYTSIQHAIDDTLDGDVIVLTRGVYTPPTPFGTLTINRGITLTSDTPAGEANSVADTVLNGYSFFITNLGAERAIIDGLTIRFGN
ncbi:MAG: right-handed parallel beta-helix repeat-containing protein, partial [Planctomycetota bacterium]